MYVDVLFALNFMMDLLVLLTASLLCGRRGARARHPWLRVSCAAGFGAAGSCLLASAELLLDAKWLSEGVGALLLGILLCAGMAWIAYRPRSGEQLLRRVMAVYGCAFLIGGICDWLRVHMRALPYFALLLAAVAASAMLLWRQARMQERRARFAAVRIFTGSGTISVKALVDTGNMLTLPGTQTPVSVIGRDAFWPALSGTQREQYQRMCMLAAHEEADEAERCKASGWTLVPYRSIGCAYGMLPAVCVPHAYVTAADGGERHLERMWLAVSAKPLSEQYEMILHPAHIPLTD